MSAALTSLRNLAQAPPAPPACGYRLLVERSPLATGLELASPHSRPPLSPRWIPAQLLHLFSAQWPSRQPRIGDKMGLVARTEQATR